VLCAMRENGGIRALYENCAVAIARADGDLSAATVYLINPRRKGACSERSLLPDSSASQTCRSAAAVAVAVAVAVANPLIVLSIPVTRDVRAREHGPHVIDAALDASRARRLRAAALHDPWTRTRAADCPALEAHAFRWSANRAR